ncbi:MAG: ribonuclease HI [Spirochaetia bacterium]|nr:ribonuclease HI [Spirochaetia bacterium]
MDPIIIYTDGACSGNPGPGGWAFVVVTPAEREGAGAERTTTNNRMELMAVIEALKTVRGAEDPVEVRTDSQYVKNGITQWISGWKRNGWRTASKTPVKNKELWVELDALVAETRARFVWVEGHAGEKYNERCDELAREAIASLSRR